MHSFWISFLTILLICYQEKCCTIFFIIIFDIFLIPIIIIASISLYINHQYVINFMNKINETYENNKVNFCWEIMIIIHMTILIIFPLITYNFYMCGDIFEAIFKCNLCECGECKIFKCVCDFGHCECLKCLKSCGCDCNCNCFKCFKKDSNNNNNYNYNIPSENININNTDITNEILPLKNMISNMIAKTDSINTIKGDIVEIKNNLSNQNNFLNNLKNNKSDDEIKETFGNIKILCSNCSEKINNISDNINNCKNEINKFQNEILHMNNNFNEEINQLKKDVKQISDIHKDCLENFKKLNSENNKKVDNELKMIIKYENKVYLIIINNNCSFIDFMNKIKNSISSNVNSISNNNLKLYYWNQFGQKNKIMDEKDFLNALSLHIFYFELINEKNNQIRQQNYISNKDN